MMNGLYDPNRKKVIDALNFNPTRTSTQVPPWISGAVQPVAPAEMPPRPMAPMNYSGSMRQWGGHEDIGVPYYAMQSYQNDLAKWQKQMDAMQSKVPSAGSTQALMSTKTGRLMGGSPIAKKMR